jgi:hypothetical protein
MSRALTFVWVGVVVSLCASAVAAAAEESPNPLGRFLLVAAEGLYIVEPDLKPSWSHTFPPPVRMTLTQYDDMVSDGWVLPSGNVLYAANRYVREIDREHKTVWEYRVEYPAEVKTCVPLADGRTAIVHSGEQAILELAPRGQSVERRISLPAEGTEHTRYNLLRVTPAGTYLVALRTENRFVEVDRDGKIIASFKVLSLPVVATREADGSTLCSARVEVTRFNPAHEKVWSYTRTDAEPEFPMIIAAGTARLADGRIIVVNSDWHYPERDRNRVQLFAVDEQKHISWTLPSSAFEPWKKSWTEKKTGLVEHRCLVIQRLE